MEFPFANVTANELSFAERDEQYRRLHEWPERSYSHPSGLRMIWKYDDVRAALEAVLPGITNANSLDPLVGYPRIAVTPAAVFPFIRHLFPPPAKATANLTDTVLHKQVWDILGGSGGCFTIAQADRAAREVVFTEQFRAALESLPSSAGRGATLDVSALSTLYAARVTGDAVGLAPEMWRDVAMWSGAQSGLLGRPLRGRELGDAVCALGWLFTICARAVARGSDAGGLAQRLRAAGLPRRIAVSAMANSLAAGVHTVSGTIQQGVQRLLADPHRAWWSLLPDPAHAAEVAVKLLQLDPGLVAWKRRADRSITLGSGTTLPPGPVLVMFAAANRDSDAFPRLWDLTGKGKLPLTFGSGRHVCPGKQLATSAITVFLRELHALTPNARSLEAPAVTGRRPDLMFSGADITVST
ncbi:hypothetical protein [Nocardia sp. NPDC057030]|uniref:hypothetical protein n=1 Tax=unclassified Nocardia TaxID=2637762 RepID=UPI00362B1BA2